MADIILELGNGSEVELHEIWACDNDLYDGSESGSYIEVIDTETNEVLCTLQGSLPDMDDEDFDVDNYIDEIGEQIMNNI